MCLLCEKTFSNDTMKAAKMRDHLERFYYDKKNKDLKYFKMLWLSRYRMHFLLSVIFETGISFAIFLNFT